MAMSPVASEKNREMLFIDNVFYKQISLRVVSLVFRGHDLLKIANIYPQQEATLSLGKNKFPEREPEMEPRSWLTPKRRFA